MHPKCIVRWTTTSVHVLNLFFIGCPLSLLMPAPWVMRSTTCSSPKLCPHSLDRFLAHYRLFCFLCPAAKSRLSSSQLFINHINNQNWQLVPKSRINVNVHVSTSKLTDVPKQNTFRLRSSLWFSSFQLTTLSVSGDIVKMKLTESDISATLPHRPNSATHIQNNDVTNCMSEHSLHHAKQTTL